MTTPGDERTVHAKGRYAAAAVLLVGALAVTAVVATMIVRALIGYDITPVAGEGTITVGDRDVAVWIAPDDGSRCSAVDTGTNQPSLSDSSSTSETITDGGREWTRIGVIRGAPGSQHLLSCDTSGFAAFGYADNPRLGHWVTVGLIGGGVAGLLALGAFVLALVTMVQGQRAKVRANPPVAPPPPPPPPFRP